MTPLEKAKDEEGRVNYCDECEQFEIVGNACYCKVDGKLIHPIMLARGQGTGAAWNCKKRKKPITNYDRIVSKTPEELAMWIAHPKISYCQHDICDGETDCAECALQWLKEEVNE